MKLFDCFSDAGFHSSVVTTFGVDFNAYESIVLSRLREAGCHNNVLIADDRMLGLSLSDAFQRPAHAGRWYSVAGALPSGVFHPKLVVQLGTKAGRMLVASANMTSAGLAGNLEVVGSVSTSDTDRQAVPLFQAAVAYLQQFLAPRSVARRQLDWAVRRTPWLKVAADADADENATVALEDGGRLAFVVNAQGTGVGQRFLELVGERQVKRLVVASPYWDPNLAALGWLRRGLDPKNTAVLVQRTSALFPVHSYQAGGGIDLFDTNNVKGTVPTRFAHAKVFVAETEDADCVLFGSANCTLAALGGDGSAGVNQEVCLYRELSAGQAAQLLGLNEALTEAARISAADLPAYEQTDDIPLEELAGRLPGRFELAGNILQWWPPTGASAHDAELLLLDQTGTPNGGELVPLHSRGEVVSYRFAGSEPPHFAQARWPTIESSIAVVVVEQAIQQSQRRMASKAVENALTFLDDEEAFEGLWLLELIDAVTPSPENYRPGGSSDSSTGPERPEAPQEAKVLPYAEFISGRDVAKGVEVGSHLATTPHESVRGFLNALLGSNSRQFQELEVDPEAPNLSTTGETANPLDAVEAGEEFEGTPRAASPTDLNTDDKQMLRRRQAYYKDTQKSIADAVHRFIGDVKRRTESQDLGITDLLRLRVLLMVVLGAGSNQATLLPTDPNAKISRRQVLPSQGESGWPTLVGRLLFAFFRSHGGSTGPLVGKLVVGAEGNAGIPDDILECWATCFWAACAMHVAIDDKKQRLKPPLKKQEADEDLYRATRIVREEALGERVKEFFSRLDQRFAQRLGATPAEIDARHRSLVAGTMPSSRLEA